MGKKNSKIQQETVPPLAQYLAQRAQQVRDSAALELQQQEAPDVPVLPRTSDNTIAYWDAKLGTPDSTLIERYGVEPNPETCIYTVTTKYGDKDATFTGNKTFKDEYNKRGYVKIPNDSSSTGDLVQLNQLFGLPLVGRPYHAIMQTSTSEEGTPLYSYSRGDTTPYVVEDGRKIATMQKDRPLKNIKGRADSYTTYRYVGSPSKREEWTNEYNNKYGTQRSNGRLGVTTRWSEGGSLKEKSAWDNLSLAEKAEMIGVAVKNGITTLHEIRAKYNEFAEGGDKETLTPWKALENIDYTEVPDTAFTREKTGAGSIEVMFKDTPKEGYEYGTGYKYPHPMPGHNVVIYNPKDNDAQDIRLDALHIMPQDATYDALRSELAYYADNSDIANNARGRMEDDIKQYGHPIPGMTYQDYYNNEVDGFLRNMFIEGSPEYIASKRYYPNQQELKEWNKELMPYVDRIHNYLLTGERPANVLPEVVITGKKHELGGPLVDYLLNEYDKGGKIRIRPYILEGKRYYKNGGVLEGDFDVEDLSREEIEELNKLGYIVEIL